MSHDILICHTATDAGVAEAACTALERGGHRCWLAAREYPQSVAPDIAALDAIRASRLVVLILSRTSVNSPALREVAERAANAGLPLMTFRLSDAVPTEALAAAIGAAHEIGPVAAPLDSHFAYLATAADRLLDGESVRGRSLTMPPRPMPRANRQSNWLPIVIAGAIGIAATAAVALYVAAPGTSDAAP
ncbi:MAG: toll/interleukin-1 receptor domain-containing protein [Sphingomonas sp.]|nr:toll/interleukin-1 receptor domain-containing protein [Sphingomonas sp.]